MASRRRFHTGLLTRIIIAIFLGLGLGFVMPVPGARLFVTFNGLFSEFLRFLIPFIIVGFVTPAIADIGRKAGKVLLVTALIAYVATVGAGLLSYFTGVMIFPGLLPGGFSGTHPAEAKLIEPFFKVDIPPAFDVMTALVLAFMLGVGIAFTSGTVLRRGAAEFRDIVAKTIRTVIIPCCRSTYSAYS